MQAMDIANDALDSVLGNYKAALKITVPILGLGLGLIALLSFDFWQTALSGNGFGARAILKDPFGTVRVVLIPLLIVITSLYWVTITWHRFIILDEQPRGVLPKLHLGSIWAYIWRLSVLSFVIGFMTAVPLATLSRIFGGNGRINIANYADALASGPVAVIFNILGTIFFTYAFLRYSPFLVAAAIGKPIMASTGRQASLWARNDIALMAVGYALVTLVYALVGAGVSSGFWQIDLAIVLALQWVAFMFTISLLTTLYQKSVEKVIDPALVDNLSGSEPDTEWYSKGHK